jgi:ribosomal protein S8E
MISSDLRRQQAAGIKNSENENVRKAGQCETQHRKYRRFKMGVNQSSKTVQANKLCFSQGAK